MTERWSREAQALAAAPFTYPDVGAVLDELPAGYRHVRSEVPLTGDKAFRRVREGILAWRISSPSGVRQLAGPSTVTPGAVYVARAWRLPIVLRCRVVDVVDQPDCAGFVYGTLAGHPVRGEESFLVHRNPDGSVSFVVTAFSRPASPLARLAGPLGGAFQGYATWRYGRAAKALAAGA